MSSIFHFAFPKFFKTHYLLMSTQQNVSITPHTPIQNLTQYKYIETAEKMEPIYDELSDTYLQDEFGHPKVTAYPNDQGLKWAGIDNGYFRPDISGLYCDEIRNIGMNPFAVQCGGGVNMNRQPSTVARYTTLGALERKTWSTPRQMFREPQLYPHSQYKRIYSEIYPRTNGRLGDAIFTGYPLYDNAI